MEKSKAESRHTRWYATVGLFVMLSSGLFAVLQGCGEETPDREPRIEQAILVIGGAGDEMPFTDIAMAWVPSENQWYHLTNMPTRRRAMAYSPYKGKLYVIGGWTDQPEEEAGPGGLIPLDIVEIYDPITDSWERGANMPTKRGKMAHMYPAVDGKIPVAGGERMEERLNEAAIYDINRDEWEVIDDMPDTWTFPYVMANPRDSNLVHFAAGNTDAQENMQDWHSVLDMETYEWDHQAKASYPIEITDGDGSILYRDLWWTFGGWSHELGSVVDVYAYNFDDDRWEEMPHPPFESWSHQGASVIEFNGEERIFMMGGRTDQELTDEVWYFDNNEWRQADTRMPVALWNFICVTMDVNLDNLEPVE